jgi:ABC-2 type transport system permease protein
VPGTWALTAAVVVLTVGLGAGASAAVGHPAGVDQDMVKTSLTGVSLGQAVVAVLAVLVIAGEYGGGMIRTTFAAMPRRQTVLAAKAAVLTAAVLTAGTVAVTGSLVVGRLLLPGSGGHPPYDLTDASTLRAAAGSVLYLALIALLGLGLATAVRDSGAATGSVLGLLYLFPVVASLVPDPHWQRHLQQAGPMTAGLAVQTTTASGLHSLPIGPWPGLGVAAAWAAAALLGGGTLLRLRDA